MQIPQKFSSSLKRVDLKGLIPFLFILPAILFVVGILGYAVVRAFITSFYQVDMYTIGEPFVGLENYIELFKSEDFRNSLIRSLIFVGSSVGLGLCISMAFALCLHRIKWLTGIFRGISLIPYMVSGVAAAIMWRFLFSGNAGLINLMLKTMGQETLSWLGHGNRALLVVILANTWFLSPLATLFLLSGLQSIDPQLYDAAKVDGATGFSVFRHITFPLLKPMLGVSLIWLNFASFNMFDIILPMTGGGPGRSTELMAVYLYKLAFEQVNISSAAAIMVILLIINVTISSVITRSFKI